MGGPKMPNKPLRDAKWWEAALIGVLAGLILSSPLFVGLACFP